MLIPSASKRADEETHDQYEEKEAVAGREARKYPMVRYVLSVLQKELCRPCRWKHLLLEDPESAKCVWDAPYSDGDTTSGSSDPAQLEHLN